MNFKPNLSKHQMWIPVKSFLMLRVQAFSLQRRGWWVEREGGCVLQHKWRIVWSGIENMRERVIGSKKINCLITKSWCCRSVELTFGFCLQVKLTECSHLYCSDFDSFENSRNLKMISMDAEIPSLIISEEERIVCGVQCVLWSHKITERTMSRSTIILFRFFCC